MARYQVRKQVDGYAVVSVATGLVAVANGHLLEGLDDEDASDLVYLINCVEGEVLLDIDDTPDDAGEEIAVSAPSSRIARKAAPVPSREIALLLHH